MTSQMELPEGLDLVAVHGADACFVRRTDRHRHPMPLLEGAGVDPLTSRSIGTVAHLAAHAVVLTEALRAGPVTDAQGSTLPLDTGGGDG